jgi:hypothetical protein
MQKPLPRRLDCKFYPMSSSMSDIPMPGVRDSSSWLSLSELIHTLVFGSSTVEAYSITCLTSVL